LERGRVRLEPFEERHREGLAAVAAAHPDLFRHIPFPVAAQGYSAWFDLLREDQAAGRSIPHAVIVHAPPRAGELSSASRETEGGVAADAPLRFASLSTSPASGGGQIVGQSCYLNIRPRDAGVEIGSTWYARAAQATFVNPSCKLLLLGNAFDQGAERVELKTDALNNQSRAAMLKMGAQFEGIHRKHMRRADGSLRDTAWFSVVREEWSEVKAGLETRLAAFV
jgi:N-acetyltransferase